MGSNFYNGSVRLVDGKPEDTHDWEVDTMSDLWNPERAVNALKQRSDSMLCDVLLDQNIFAGSGNIVKNEVLFMTMTHPETLVGVLSLIERRNLLKHFEPTVSISIAGKKHLN